MNRTRINLIAYGLAVLLVLTGLGLYSAAIIPETLYRLGMRPLSSLSPELIDVIEDLSIAQNIAFYLGYVVGLVGLAALVLRRAVSLYIILVAAGLQLIDWIMMPLAGQTSGNLSGLSDLALPLIVAALLIYLRQEKFLR